MQSSAYLDVICHLPWRSPRRQDRRVLILPDGNSRVATNLEGYAAGADKVVACAEHLATRGDISTLVMCIASEQNAMKRDERFFQAVSDQFSRLRTNVFANGVLLRSNIRCRALGDLARLYAMGGARSSLVDETIAVCTATSSVSRPRLNVEFLLAYSDEIAWQSDIDLVVRTGAEEPDVVRPGLSLPPNVPCAVTTTLWPQVNPEQVGSLIDFALRDQVPQFAPGYSIEFIEALLHTLPGARIPAPFRLTIPVCAPDKDIINMLKRVYGKQRCGPAVATHYLSSHGAVAQPYGADDDVWYSLRIVAAAQWQQFARESYDAIVAPGQHAGLARLAMPAGAAHVHSCAEDIEHILHALNNAIRFPAKHTLLHGANRSQAAALARPNPWPTDLLDLLQRITTLPNLPIERLVSKYLPSDADDTEERAMLIKGISVKMLMIALDEGLLLPDEPMRQGDRNYAYTGAYMMLRVPDECDPSGMNWEKSAEIAIRCMLAVSAGDNGVFDRILPGETPAEWSVRLEASARYFDAIAHNDTSVEPPNIRRARLVVAIGTQWQALLTRPSSNEDLVRACRDALQRHYQANLRERAPDVVDNPLVQWLCLGGLPRREAVQEIEKRYTTTTPHPIGLRIRDLLGADVTDPARFQAVRNEVQLLLYLADTAHSIAVEVLFLFCALATPKEAITTTRLRILIAVGQLGDYTFRLANDLASLSEAVGGDQDQTKESSLSILIPKVASVLERAAKLRMARELGAELLDWLEEQLGKAMICLRAEWPSMAAKVERAVRIGRGVYEQSHYTKMTSDEMLELIRRVDTAACPVRQNQPVSPGQTVRRQDSVIKPLNSVENFV